MPAPSSRVGHPCPMASSTSATKMDTFSPSACSAGLVETVDRTAADSVCNRARCGSPHSSISRLDVGGRAAARPVVLR
jgi:hypothetical protein